LIIGISHYDNPDLYTLDFCKKDAEGIYELLKSIGYQIQDNHKLIGEVKYDVMKNAIKDFFTKNNESNDILLFYFSGHGIVEGTGRNYLATSDIDPDEPYDKGYSFDDFNIMYNERTIAKRIVVILDCCYSGAAKVSKGNEEDEANFGREAIATKIKTGEGKCILASSLSYQKSYAKKEQGHSIFTHYIIEGLKGDLDSVDNEGNVTPDSLGNYAYDQVTKIFPRQKPVKKVEIAGQIILAHYPEKIKIKGTTKTEKDPLATITEEANSCFSKGEFKKAIEKYEEALQFKPNNEEYLYYNIANAYYELNNKEEAKKYYRKSTDINPKFMPSWRALDDLQPKRKIPIWVFGIIVVGIWLGSTFLLPFPYAFVAFVISLCAVVWKITSEKRTTIKDKQAHGKQNIFSKNRRSI
jgi:hypothetical protein